jgi:hypothetical protein
MKKQRKHYAPEEKASICEARREFVKTHCECMPNDSRGRYFTETICDSGY